MASFGQQFIASLTQPSYSEGMFKLGSLIGQAPALAAERKKKAEEYELLSSATNQAQASAVAGDPRALALNISKLEQLKAATPSIEQKKAIDSRIFQLRNLLPDVEKRGIQNEIKAVSTIDTTLKDLDTTTEQGKLLKETFENRKAELLKDPDVQKGYRQAQLDEFKFNQDQKTMLEQNYIQENQGKLLAAVQSNDQDRIDAVLDSAPDEFAAVTNDFITGAIRNQQVLNQFKENSLELKNKPLTDSQLDAIVQGLPEEVRSGLSQEIANYKDARKGWNEKTGWSGNTQAYQYAKQADKALRNAASDLARRSLFLDIDYKRKVRAQEEVIVRDAELALEDRPTDVNIQRRAEMITEEKDGEPTLEDRANALRQLQEENIEQNLRIINRYNPERAAELGYVAPENDSVMGLEDAFQTLTADPSEENQQFFKEVYGEPAFKLWQEQSGTETKPSALDTAFGVPAREVARVVRENVIEPVSGAVSLAGARREVGQAFNQFGGNLNAVSLESLELVQDDTGFSKANRDKIKKEIRKRRNNA